MPIASSTRLAPHFTAGELGADDPTASAQVIANLTDKVAPWLEWYRGLLGSRLRVTSGYRSPTHNVEVGGVPTSDHPNGLAADVVALDISQWDAHTRFKVALQAGAVPVWDQLVYYPVTGHIHVGLGIRNRREVRIKLIEGGSPILTAELGRKLRRGLPVIVLFAFLLFAFILRGSRGAA